MNYTVRKRFVKKVPFIYRDSKCSIQIPTKNSISFKIHIFISNKNGRFFAQKTQISRTSLVMKLQREDSSVELHRLSSCVVSGSKSF